MKVGMIGVLSNPVNKKNKNYYKFKKLFDQRKYDLL